MKVNVYFGDFTYEDVEQQPSYEVGALCHSLCGVSRSHFLKADERVFHCEQSQTFLPLRIERNR